jgi:hypothetical protein
MNEMEQKNAKKEQKRLEMEQKKEQKRLEMEQKIKKQNKKMKGVKFDY